jgi:hypothetical protein
MGIVAGPTPNNNQWRENMKMAKASEKDIDAAGELMRILNDISGGHYPAKDGEYTEDIPTFFDPDDKAHLRHFYDLVDATLDKAPGYPGRIIGGMCYVILYDKNEIVDPDADTLELHPKLVKAMNDRDELVKALQAIVALNDRSASDQLAQTGSYSGFDEPGSVMIARDALAKAGVQS